MIATEEIIGTHHDTRNQDPLVYINLTHERVSPLQVETFFKLTPGLKFEVILTQRANHARDYILEMSAEQWQSIDGLVSVGGDGLFNELLSGALLRTQLEAGTNIDDPDSDQLQTPHIRFGIIGAGSANSIVSTVHETADYATAAVHIAIGSECNVDVCTVHENNKLLRISANAISYGWLGDVLRDSERYRWLGPIRYQWSGIGDGTLDLALVPRISRCHNIQFMRKVAMYGGKGVSQLHLYLHLLAKPIYLAPDADQTNPGVWNLDGEILEQPKGTALHFRLHPQLISFFGRDAAMIEPSKRKSFMKKRKSSIVYN
ncbi:diacylglycerol kinase catalytic domain protein [Ancylostoma ceylanicum]|uniref:Diacylglycerol kinase catalytic domain protein n=1 Tax=Ancylostoma ceylanicum TaxID=53326 RepID=A0A0D6LFR9_9BILA|nr:diacylglycerol kinase catalytic domain protein [Ancylostoma ceylanicum]